MKIRPRVHPFLMEINWDCVWFCWGICAAISEGWGGVICYYGCQFVCDDSLINVN
jgi:hypothetical protein